MRRLVLMVLATVVAATGSTDASASGDEPPASVVPDVVLAELHADRRHPAALSDEQVGDMVRETLRDCGLPVHTARAAAPWYLHYELGLRLVDAGDAQRAVDALLEAVDRRPLPDERVRMYGMWFIDYRPYLEIAACHVALGNWECAFNALALSRATGELEVSAADDPTERYLDLVEETLAHVGKESE